MTFGGVCLIIAVVALVIAMINGRAADSSLALPMLAIFAIAFIAGGLSFLFDSWIVGVVVIIAIALWLCNSIWS